MLRRLLMTILLSTAVIWCESGWGVDSDITDYGSGSNAITAVNAPTSQNTTNKVWEYCYDFNGTTQYLHANGFISDTSANSTGTFSAWIYLDVDTGTQDYIISCNDGVKQDFVGIAVEAGSDYIMFGCYSNGGWIWRWASSNGYLTGKFGAWHHVMCVQDGVEPEFYFDGTDITASEGSFTTSTDKTVWFDSLTLTNFEIAARTYDATLGGYFDGKIDDVRYWASALTSANATTLYGGGSGYSSALGGEVFWMHSVNALTAYSDNDTSIGITDSQPDIVDLIIDGTRQINFEDGSIYPETDDDIDLGDATHEFKDAYIDGTANIDTLTDGTATLTGGELLDLATVEATTTLGLEIGDVQQLTLTDGALTPTTDNDIDLGSTTKGIKNGYVTGDILPTVTNSSDIGSSTKVFAEGHYSTVYVGGAVIYDPA